MIRVLVSGPDGFVGSATCSRLIEAGHAVRGAQRQAAPLAGGCESVVVGDINASTDWSEALKEVDAVVHLAARVYIMDDPADDPLAAFRSVNVEGTRRLAEEAAGASVKRFVFVSSIKVNGEKTEGRRSEVGGRTKDQTPGAKKQPAAFTEHDVPAPEDPYGQSKWEAEVVLREIEAAAGMEVTILRPPLLYGPGVKANFLKLIRLVDKGMPLPLGGIENRRSLLGLTNFSDLIATCVQDPRAAGQTFTVCDGEDISSAELVRRIASALGKKPFLLPVPEGLMRLAGRMAGKSAEVERLCSSLAVDSSRVRNTLDWQPPCTMKEELARTIAWYRSLQSATGSYVGF